MGELTRVKHKLLMRNKMVGYDSGDDFTPDLSWLWAAAHRISLCSWKPTFQGPQHLHPTQEAASCPSLPVTWLVP